MEATFGPVVYMEYVEGVGMKEIYGNLWNAASDLRVISTNGIVRKDGACVMGRGCAHEAKTRFPGIEFRLGELLREHGNRVMRLGRYGGTMISSFPVKHHWRQEADPVLIRRSAEQLVALADKFGHERVVIPRPGCGNGKLRWSDVRKVLADILDDRFMIITFPPKGRKAEKAEIIEGKKAEGRYIFCGSRDWDEAIMIHDKLQSLPAGAIVVAGGASGADRIAEDQARRLGLKVEVYPARWDEEGRGAGCRRNKRMLELPNVAGVFAFRVHGKSASPGTDHMVRISREAEVSTEVNLPAKPPIEVLEQITGKALR
jgi:hypothetical protein